MRTLRFCVDGQKLQRNLKSDFTGIIRGSRGYLQCSFSLSKEWANCKIAASFWWFDQEIQTQAVLAQIAESEDKTLGIQCMALFPVYVQNKQHEVGEVATHPETGYPKECILAYDGTVQQDWTIDTPTCWKPWHSRKVEYALPWEQPTGAHDMYKAGEYMIWTDGSVKKCVQDTNFSPTEYPQAWEDA